MQNAKRTGDVDKQRDARAFTVVLGNEKGGSGKTTTAVHIAVALARMGFSVGTIDLDGHQRSLTRFMDNRQTWINRYGLDVAPPDHALIRGSEAESRTEARNEDERTLLAAYLRQSATKDFIVIDCAGSVAPLSNFALTLADALITPVNDSLVDLDLIAELNPLTMAVERPGVYALLVAEQRKRRIAEKRPGIDWIVLRNRLPNLHSRNSDSVGGTLADLAGKIGYRMAHGIRERVIFRQLFVSGLTVLDLAETTLDIPESHSLSAAREEIRGLLRSLWLPRVDGRIDRL